MNLLDCLKTKTGASDKRGLGSLASVKCKTISNTLRAIKSSTHGKVFLAVLLIKMIVVLLNSPELYTAWFIPFIKNFVHSGYQNPWNTFLANNGFSKAFPYGTGMLISFVLPFSLKSFVFGLSDTVARSDICLMSIPIMLADLGILSILIYPMKLDTRRSVYIYWCSPVVFYISYIHGQLDIVPMLFMLASLVFLINERILLSALLLGIGLATKANLLVAMPFMFIYILRKKASWGKALLYALYTFTAYAILIVPVFFSNGYQQMVLGATERTWILLLYIKVAQFKIFLVPLVVCLLYMKFSTYKTLNKEILIMYIGLAFTVLVFLIPVNAPGWYMWIVPFLCYYYISSTKFHVLPLAVFSLLFIIFFLIQVPYPINIIDPSISPVLLRYLRNYIPESQVDVCINLIFTFIEGVVLYFAVTMYIYGVRANRIYKEAESITIGIGGDSGSGKDTLCDSLRGLLGEKDVLQVNGDDIHRWERGNKSWKSYTHLDPKANDLFLQFYHTKSLIKGLPINRRFYDHDTGQFSEPNLMKPRKYIFISGLHPFYLRNMRNLIDIKIYLDTDKELRTLWKIQRDMKHRGYSKEKVIKSMAGRQEDGLKYIKPQKDHADVIIRYEEVDKESSEKSDKPKIGVKLTIDNSINLEKLLGELSEFRSITVKHWYADIDKQFLLVKGSINSKNVEEVAYRTVHNVYELIRADAKFEDDLKGVVQLVFLCVLNHHKSYEDIVH